MRSLYNCEITDIKYDISEDIKNNYEITDDNEFFQRAVTCFISHEKLEDGLLELYTFLKHILPVTYIFFTPPYESQNMKHIVVTEDGIRYYDNTATFSSLQTKKLFELRNRFSKNKIFYISSKDASNSFFSVLNHMVALPLPCLYFYFMYQGHIQGSLYFGCPESREFSERHIHLLSLLWEHLFFVTRFYYQQYRLENILKLTQESNHTLKNQVSGFQNIIGMNSGLQNIARELRLISPFDISVLFTGETGTGKDLFARELHRLSPRGDKPFISVNCGGITSTLIDSELFGYNKGAFTGAIKDYKGRFERAHGGTIFLDEIGELPLDEQTRLLEVLQNKTIERLGGNTPIPVDFRLICATNKDLQAMVREGTFREDLYFRLAGVTVRIPPLRERLGDIPLLVQHVLQKEAVRYGVPVPPLAEGEMQKLLNYSWPGNVRELINVATEAFVRSLPNGKAVFNVGSHNTACSKSGYFPLKSYSDMKREYFQHLLDQCGGRISGTGGTAESAGLNPNTLRSKLDKLGIAYGRRA